MLINIESSLVYLSFEYNMLLFLQIKYCRVRENRLTNSHKLSILVLEGLVVVFLSRSCTEKLSHGPYNYSSRLRGASTDIQILGEKALVRKDVIGQRELYIL